MRQGTRVRRNQAFKYQSVEYLNMASEAIRRLPSFYARDEQERLESLVRRQLGSAYLLAILNGLPPASAAQLCGVSKHTFDNIMANGKRGAIKAETDGGHFTLSAMFYTQTNAFVALQKERDLLRIQEELDENPALWATYLSFQERINPENYARKSTIGIEENKNFTFTMRRVDSDEWLTGTKANIESEKQSLIEGEVIDTVLEEANDGAE